MRLKFIGKAYSGLDPETGKNILAKTGTEVVVSDMKGAQLLKDFPKDWQKVIVESAPEPEEPPKKKGRK